ncbi:MAG: DUF58 domain-containing protein [Deltaproteobacteria bacterium]|nr:DUF58 domain-containing protein [Deltaproteobacteria bacterium]
MELEASARPAEVDPRVLAEVGNLAFRARIVADSVLHGMHRSRHHGTSVEFAEHKEYAPGDNVRHLDWRAFARLDRDYVKRYLDEAHIRAWLVVDTSASMGYRPEAPRATKLEYAKLCAGALAYLLARQGDAVGLATFSERLSVEVPSRARRGHLMEMLTRLEALSPNGETKLTSAIDSLVQGMSRRTIVLVLTDLFDAGDDALDAIARLAAKKHDVVLFQLLDPDELQLPFEDHTEFASLEDDRVIAADPDSIRAAYLEEIERFLHEVESRARAARVEHHLLRTDRSPGAALGSFLSRRMAQRTSAR